MGEILVLLAKGVLGRTEFLRIIEQHELEREPWFPKQRLDLVLDFISELNADGRLDADELDATNRLKTCLGVKEGEFVSLRPAEVAAILSTQLEEMLEDDS